MELIYGYVRDRQQSSRAAFAAKHAHPVIVVKKLLAENDTGDTQLLTHVDDKAVEMSRMLRHEAHQYRVLALVPGATIGVGRATENKVVIADDSVSRRHAILRVGADIVLEDLGSDNGTYIVRAGEKKRVDGAATVLPGDVVVWGIVKTPVLGPHQLYDFLSTLLDPRATPGSA